MPDDQNMESLPPMKRRSFFGYLVAGAVGGFVATTLGQKILSRKSHAPPGSEPVRISINPLAVPRTKENSKTNV